MCQTLNSVKRVSDGDMTVVMKDEGPRRVIPDPSSFLMNIDKCIKQLRDGIVEGLPTFYVRGSCFWLKNFLEQE